MICRSLAVIGGGVMGRGIAHVFADAGIAVTLVTSRPAEFAYPGVTVASELPPAAPDIVLESVIEDTAIKHAVFARVEAAYGGAPVLATNTSGLSLEELAKPLKFPARFLGMHFFMPAEAFAMIEVVRTQATDPAALELAVAAVRQSGREPILLEQPIPGYLFNRLQHAILHEAYHLIDGGITDAATIDAVAKRLLGPRMCITGLIEQKDISGLETHARGHRAIVPTLAHTGVPTARIQGLLDEGRVGIRSGGGFYDWGGRDADAIAREAADRLTRLLDFLESEKEKAP